jgi:hypothetical protein
MLFDAGMMSGWYLHCREFCGELWLSKPLGALETEV